MRQTMKVDSGEQRKEKDNKRQADSDGHLILN